MRYSEAKTDAQSQPVKDAESNPVMLDKTTATQSIAMGPVASQEVIKMLSLFIALTMLTGIDSLESDP